MTAVTFALPSESSEFVRLLKRTAPAAHQPHVIAGMLENRRVSVLHTGVGENVARERVQKFLEEYKPDRLISAGFAGGVTAAVKPGDILLGENVSSPSILTPARALLGVQARVGKLITASSIVDAASSRRAFAERGATAVDMESEHIAELCARAGVPMLSLRAISDTIEFPFPAPAEVLFDVSQQRTRLAPLLFHLLAKPMTTFALILFAKQIALTRRSLAAALHRLFQSDVIPHD